MSTLDSIAQQTLALSSLLGSPSPVQPSANASPALVDAAAQLAQEESAIVELGGGIDDRGATYDAAGLLNSFTQAGSLSSGFSDNTDQQLIDTLFGSGSSNSGSLPGLNAAFAQALQANPQLAGVAVQDSLNGALIDTLA